MRLPNGYRIMTLNINCLVNNNSRIGLLEVLKRSEPDVLCLQEVNIPENELQDLIDNLGYQCFSNSVENGRGTAILWKKSVEICGKKAVVVNRIISIELNEYLIINVYAPSGRALRMARGDLFNKDLSPFLASSGNKKVILCGDFNCILENFDAANNPQQKKSKELKALVSTNKLIDSYRFFHPHQPGYTFIRNNSASRIDYLFLPVSEGSNIVNVDLVPVPASDHIAVCVDIKINGNQTFKKAKHKGNYWKLNNEILCHPDFEENFLILYSKLLNKKAQFNEITEWWEVCAKPEITKFLKIFSRSLALERNQTKEGFYFMLKLAIDQGMAGFEEALLIKHRLNSMIRCEMEGVKIRSRFQENVENERGSLYHLAREKKNGEKNNLEVMNIDGKEVSDQLKIQENVLGYFNKLFNGKLDRTQDFVMEVEKLPELLNENLGKISDADKEMFCEPFSMAELEFVVKRLPNNKSPGLDGLSNEFYKKVFHVIKNEYLEVQNLYQEVGKVGSEMRKGVTRLLPKTVGVPTIEKVRPITMLIPDYSIKSRLLTNRLSGVMEDIIKSSQLCNSKKVNIQTGVHNILSTIEYVNMKNLPGALLSFDMSKAFDRCYIPFVCKVLEKMNFPEKFIDVILDMHTNISTCFLLNGLSPEVNLIFSIRQGDPIAMPLYTIYMEPLLVNLEAECKGIRIGDSAELDEPYADDVEVLVDDDKDFVKVNQIFEKFESLSGAVLSRSEKSKVMGFGCWRERVLWPLPWLKCVKQMKVYGFEILPSYAETLDKNWKAAVQNIRKAVLSFDLRSLNTINQRVDVLNIFVLPKLWYKCAVLPLPADTARQVESIMIKFLWRGKLEKISLIELCNDKSEGGLGLVEIRSKADSLILKQTCRILSATGSKGWYLSRYWMGLYLAKHLPDMKPGPHSWKVSEMYKHIKFLLEECLDGEDYQILERQTAKLLYKNFVSTLPPPKVLYKKSDGINWDHVWKNVNSPMLFVERREFMFLLVHNILPTGERLRRLSRSDGLCECGGGMETPEHLYFTCPKVQCAWAWMRRLMENVVPAVRLFTEEDLLNLDFKSKDILFFISFYFDYVWQVRKTDKKDVNIESMKKQLKSEFVSLQKSQNKLQTVNLVF